MQNTQPGDVSSTPSEDTTLHTAPTIPDTVAVEPQQTQTEQDTAQDKDKPQQATKFVWPPPADSYRRRRAGLSTPVAVLVFILAFLLIVSGLGFVAFSETTQYQGSLQTIATSKARATQNVLNTVQARQQGTAAALGTVQSTIDATATAQMSATNDATATVLNATATANALSDLYTQATNGTPVLDDPLNDNTGAGKWDEGSTTSNTGCTFTNNQYHASEAQQGNLQPCIAQASRFGSFAYQAHIVITKGGQGQAGLLFRVDTSNKSYYFFHYGPDGSYALDLYTSGNVQSLIQGTSSAITPGLGGSNQLAIVANSDMLYLYANNQFLDAVSDSTLSSGKIGVGVVDQNTPVDAQFSDVQVWLLQQGAQSTPTPTPDQSSQGTPTPGATAQATATP